MILIGLQKTLDALDYAERNALHAVTSIMKMEKRFTVRSASVFPTSKEGPALTLVQSLAAQVGLAKIECTTSSWVLLKQTPHFKA